MTLPTHRSPTPARRGIVQWYRSKDPDLLVVKRSVRAAVVMPLVFAIAHFAFSNPQVGLFGAFGSFALLLLVEFTGRPHARLVSYGGLYVAGACFIVLGTFVSTNRVAAVVTMALVGFGVLFAGIVAPQAATATTAALLTFVLPVAVAQPASAIGPRLLGWTIAGGLLHRGVHARVAAPLARQPPAPAVGRRLCGGPPGRRQVAGARTTRRRTTTSPSSCRSSADQFSGTPYPPTGAASGAVALSKLVGRLEWVADTTVTMQNAQWSSEPRPARAVTEQVAETLHQIAALLCDGEGHPVHDPARIEAVRSSTQRLDQLMVAALEADVVSLTDAEAAPPSVVRARARDEREHRGSARSGLPRPRARYRHRDGGRCDAGGGRGRAGERPPPRHGRRDCSTGPGPPARVASLVPLRLVPQRPARRSGPGPGRRGGRGHERLARLLGRARDHVGVALQRTRHRAPPHSAPSEAPPWGSSQGR